jgi:hypothetical protein
MGRAAQLRIVKGEITTGQTPGDEAKDDEPGIV